MGDRDQYAKRRFYLKPMEKLQQQLKGSVQVIDIKIMTGWIRNIRQVYFCRQNVFKCRFGKDDWYRRSSQNIPILQFNGWLLIFFEFFIIMLIRKLEVIINEFIN